MSEATILFVWSTLLTVAGFLFGIILNMLRSEIKSLWSSHKSLNDQNIETMQHYNNYYVRRDDYMESQRRIMDLLERIDDKLDRKVDK